MSLSPTKRTLSRQPSSPSLAVGLPPPLPESNIMQPSSPFKAAAANDTPASRTRSRKRLHRGDVSSSAASSDEETDAQITPKRKVVNTDQPTSTKKNAGRKMTLQERLQAAAAIKEGGVKAKVKKSKSNGDGLSASASVPDTSFAEASTIDTPSATTTRSEIIAPNTLPAQRTLPISSISAANTANTADKVVVCVRIKPTTNPFASSAYDLTPTSLTLSDEHPKVKQRGGKAGREEGYTYTFDKLLQYPSTTPHLYAEKVAPLVDKAMNGFNSTIFAYGQTGSGKSFTMTGNAEELGVIPCAVDGVFDAITADTDRAFLLRVSYIEIYNETLRDLLNFKKGILRDDEKPSIHTAKGKVYVEPLVEEIVSRPQDVMDLLERGNVGRRIGATDWNERSSRSHCVFTIVIESRPRDGDGDEDIRLSRLNLIDLAGSEKAVSDSERRGEGKHINQSLLALREVVHKLTEQGKVTHIPYRNSKLTHLLENALGGDSNICVICTMSGEEEHCAETLETLKFAGRCSQVKTNAKKNILPSSERALIRAKDQEIEELKLRLQSLTGQQPLRAEPEVEQVSDLAESVAAMEMRKTKLTTLLAKLNGEILTSELPRSGSGLPISPPKPKRRRISDYSALVAAPGRAGLGVGTPSKISDRRAISGMTRVPESQAEMPAIISSLSSVDTFGVKNFDHERAVAAMRRTLAAKERELVSANRDLSEAQAKASQLGDRENRIAELENDLRAALESHAALRVSLEQAENTFRDQTAQLEGTRAELVATIEDKAGKIDELEIKVLDLRKSREDLVLEDQQRLDQVQGRLDRLLAQNEEDKAKLDAVVQQLADTKKKADDAEWYRAEEVEKHKSELARMAAEQGDASHHAEAAQAKLQEYEAKTASQVKDLLAAQSSREKDFANLLSDKKNAERERDDARSDLERFQKEALANETKILAELRSEIGHLRKRQEEDSSTWKRQKRELEQVIQDEKAKADLKDQQLSVAKKLEEEFTRLQRSLEEGKLRELKLTGQMSDALKTLGEAAKAKSSLESRLHEEIDARQALEDERDAVMGRLTEAGRVHKRLEEEVIARRKAEDQVVRLGQVLEEREMAEKVIRDGAERQAGVRKELEERLASVMSEVESAQSRVEEERRAKENAERKALVLTEQLGVATTSSGDDQKRLAHEMAARQAAEVRMDDMTRQIEELRTITSEKETLLAKAIAERGELANRIEELSRQVEASAVSEQRLFDESAARATIEARAADLARQLEDVIATSTRSENRLADEAKSRELLEEEIVGLRRQLQEAQTRIADMQKRFAELDKARQEAESRSAELTTKLRSAQSSVAEAEARIEKELSERQTLEQRLVDTSRQVKGSADIKAHLDQQVAARKELEQKLLNVERSFKLAADQAETEKNARQIAEAFTEKEVAAKAELEHKLGDVERSAQLAGERMKAEMNARQIAETRLAEVSRGLVQKHESAQAILEHELLSLRQALKVSQAEVSSARATSQEAKAKTERLVAELSEAKAEAARVQKEKEGIVADLSSASSKTRIKSSRGSTASLRVGSAISASDVDEIERLERVVEVQEGIINEQREKIERWAKEMEKQREIVRLLTADRDSASMTATFNSPSVRGHAKSHSVALPSNSGISRGFPSTFTARNLALPTAASPSPLPMHPSQFDNTTTRKGRRVTIEHDIDRLAETSKVNKAKAVFESPDKFTNSQMLATPPKPMRTANSVSSVPRQRRP